MPEQHTLKHVAIIMDGNGRWATNRGKPRTFGHQAGARRVKEIIKYAYEQPCLKALTLWGFSSDNWKRPENEINALMGLFEHAAIREASAIDRYNIKCTFLGRRTALPDSLQRVMRQVEAKTATNTGLQLRLAINFSATQAQTDALLALQSRGETTSDKAVRAEMLAGAPSYDLVIRTGGEQRTSDFPVGHAELFYSDQLWPDFTPDDFDQAVIWFESRNRRFGGLNQANG